MKCIGSRPISRTRKGEVARQEFLPLILTPKPGLQAEWCWHRVQVSFTVVWQKSPGRHSQVRLELKEHGCFSTRSGSGGNNTGTDTGAPCKGKDSAAPVLRLRKQKKALSLFMITD